ncbi:MAG TPA: T9SS type A sorting domain-containing protein [Ignavibacteriaceae bacterium]|nr:T9SS type A sorting domain-containing protein [Ignavibacteriaceae bacterium]
MADSLNGIFYVAGYKLTNDGFKTFTERPRPNLNANKYFFYNCQAFYACGDSGYFAKSTDCGETWTELPFNVLNPTSINESTSIIDYSLEQNYPNPFNPSTKIKYTLPKQGLVIIKVYDVLGKEIMNLVNEEKPSGEYEVEFDGSSLSSGIYFYQIQAGEFLDTKKMVLMK